MFDSDSIGTDGTVSLSLFIGIQMRKVICSLNVFSSVVAIAVLAPLFSSREDKLSWLLSMGIAVFWFVAAVLLMKKHRLWSWSSCLLVTVFWLSDWCFELLRLFTLAWRAQYGDEAIVLDPSTIGIPIFVTGMILTILVILLIGILVLPLVSIPMHPTSPLQATPVTRRA